MDVVDALLFTLLAAGDMALMVYLRRRRNRRLRLERVSRSLVLAVRREVANPTRRRRPARAQGYSPIVGLEYPENA